ncbi:MAG: CpsD/CapB family tyrosine-protein kinase [Desulfobaccales bacterium]
MSYIEKALEKAKELHSPKKRAAPAPAPEPELVLQDEASPQIRPDTWVTPEPAEEYAFTSTRTVAVDLQNLHRQRLIVGEEFRQAGESYKLLRTRILQRTRPHGHNTLMITGPNPGEGKTLTAINLAITFSQEIGHSVILVDMDLRYPSVRHYFGLPSGPGLVDYLTDGIPLTQILVHPDGFGKLVLLPGGKPVAQAAELIGSPDMAALVQELKQFYPDRWVIFDLPPLLSVADSLAFAPLVDGIVVVVEAGKTSKEDIGRCLEMLKPFKVLGFIFNKLGTSSSSNNYSELPTKPGGPRPLDSPHV